MIITGMRDDDAPLVVLKHTWFTIGNDALLTSQMFAVLAILIK